MILVLFALGSILCAAGTRVAAASFAGAAIAATLSDGPSALLALWTAVLAGGLTLVAPQPRRLALPSLGAGAALVAAASSNAAMFLPPWLLATAAAVAMRRRGSERRWAFRLVAADVPVAAAVLWSGAAGFAAWPTLADEVTSVLFVLAAAARAPLGAGARDAAPEAGVLIARTQSLALLLLGFGVSERPDVLATVALVGGATVFGAGGAASRAGVRDGVQELGLVAAVLGADALGWTAWLWGAVAGGALTHLVRANADRAGSGRALAEAAEGGGLASPLLPAVVALALGAATDGGTVGGLTTAGLTVGLWLRARTAWRRGRRRTSESAMVGLLLIVAWAVVGPAGAPDRLPWPPAWVWVPVAVGAGLGARFAAGLVPARRRRLPGPLPAVAAGPAGRLLESAAAAPGGIGGPLVGLAGIAVGVWAVAYLRGFL